MALTSQQQDALNLFYKNLRGLAQVSPGALPDDIGYQISALVNGGGGSSLPNGQVGYGNGTGITSSSNLTTDGSGNLVVEGSVTVPIVTNTNALTLKSGVADSSSAVGNIIDTVNTFNTAGDKIVSCRNAGTEFMWATSDVTYARLGFVAPTSSGVLIVDQHLTGFQIDASAAIRLLFGGSPYLQMVGGAWEPSNDLITSSGTSTNRWSESWSVRYAGVEQTVAGASTVALVPSSGETIRLTLNSTSISAGGITIANGYPGEKLVLMVVQDTVARTLTQANFSSSFSFAGDSYTVTASASKVDVLTFAWDNTASKWRESSRALNQ